MEIEKQYLSDTIFVHDGNRLAVRALEAIFLKKMRFHPLIIHGKKGTGKSQLLKTAVKVIHEQNKFEFSSAESLKNYAYSEAYKIVLISAENLTKEILEILIFSDIKYVLIDDLQLLPKDSDIEEKLFLLNESGYIQLIATSNVEPRDLDICAKLKYQLNLGMVVNIIPEISN